MLNGSTPTFLKKQHGIHFEVVSTDIFVTDGSFSTIFYHFPVLLRTLFSVIYLRDSPFSLLVRIN